MTCQYCQTWILDDDHRCPRCGRRVRATPARISPATYPIAASATAPAYDFEAEPVPAPAEAKSGQQPLFAGPAPEPRIIPFDSLTSAAERDAIRLRAAQSGRQAPAKGTRPEPKRLRPKRNEPAEQGRLEFPNDFSAAPADARMQVFYDVPVAGAGARVQAALFDALVIACGCGPGLAMFFYLGGHLLVGKHSLPFLAAALLTIPLFYKLLWALAGQDTPGMYIAGLELVDFDGKRPSRDRRFGRLFGSILSLLAAGVGMIWTLVDEEHLAWHDHMSGTFPTYSKASGPGR